MNPIIRKRCNCWGCHGRQRAVQTSLLLVALGLASFIAVAGCSYDYAALGPVGAGDGGGPDAVGADSVPPPDALPPDAGSDAVEAPGDDAVLPDALPEAATPDLVPDATPVRHCVSFPAVVCASDADCGTCAGTGPSGGTHCPTIGATASACCLTSTGASICRCTTGAGSCVTKDDCGGVGECRGGPDCVPSACD